MTQRTAVALAVAILLSLAACGGSSSDSPTAPTPTPTPTPAGPLDGVWVGTSTELVGDRRIFVVEARLTQAPGSTVVTGTWTDQFQTASFVYHVEGTESGGAFRFRSLEPSPGPYYYSGTVLSGVMAGRTAFDSYDNPPIAMFSLQRR